MIAFLRSTFSFRRNVPLVFSAFVVVSMAVTALGCVAPVEGATLPTAPGTPRAIAGNASVTVTWEASQGADRYDVFFSGSSGSFSAQDVIENVTSPLVHKDLINGIRMFYEVRAVNVAGSVAADEVSTVPSVLATAPGAPRNLEAVGSDGRITLTWDDDDDALYYTVYRANQPGVSALTGFPTVNVDNPFVDGNSISNDINYYYVVVATYSEGDSPLSAEAFAAGTSDEPPPPPIPGVPNDLAAVAGNQQVGLAWTAVANAATYEIFAGNAPGVAVDGPPTFTSATNSFSDIGLTNGIARYYRLKAKNEEGTSAASSEVTATPNAPTGQVPSSPQGLSAIGSADSIQLSWAPAAGASYYTLYFTTTGAPTPGTGTPIVGVTSPYIHQGGLLADTTYSYVVTASNVDGESVPSNVASAVVGATGGDVGSISSTIPAGYFVDVNLKNLTTDESMDGQPDSAIILFVRTTQGAPVAGLTIGVSGGITGALSDVGNGQYQSIVANHLVPATFTFTLSGSVSGSVVVELSTMPNCTILTPTLNQVLPVGQDIEATWSLENTEFIGILVEDALGSVSYSMTGQDPNVNPWFTPAPPGLIIPGTDFTTAGSWTLKLTAGWQLTAAVGTASVRGLHTCKQSAVLQ